MSLVQTKTFEDDIRSTFERMKIVDPSDGVEFLPPKFIAPALHDLGLNPTNTEVQEILSVTDTKQQGRITYDAFCSFARQMSDSHLDDALLNKCFAVFDTNHDGVLSREEFRQALQHNGEGLTDEELDLAMQIADADGNGVINYTEFVSYMTQKDHMSQELRDRIMNFRAQQSGNFGASPRTAVAGSPSNRHGSMRGSIPRNTSTNRIASPKRPELIGSSQNNQDLSNNNGTSAQVEGTQAILQNLQSESRSLNGTQNTIGAQSTQKAEETAQKTKDSAQNASSKSSSSKTTNSKATASKSKAATGSAGAEGESISGNDSSSKKREAGDAKARQCCVIS